MEEMVKVVVGTHWGGKNIRASEKEALGYREIEVPKRLYSGGVLYNIVQLISDGYLRKEEIIFYTV